METDVEINCLRLSGSKAPRAQRPKNHKSNRQRSTDSNSSEDKHFNVYLSTRMMERPATPPNSPLVMQMYNHKKARESVLKRVQVQNERVKKKRLVYLKTTSSLEPIPAREPETVKNKQASRRLSHYSDSVLSSSVRTLPRIDDNNNSLTGCHKYNNDVMNSLRERRFKNETNQHNTQQIHQEQDAFIRKSDRKIKFDITNYDDNDYKEGDDNIEHNNDRDDDNSDSESIDSLAIQSIFVNNCNHDNTSNKYVSPWSHQKIPKNISWCPLQESYKGYLYKTNGDIVLTRKYQPPSNSSPSTKVKSETNGRHKAYNKTYRWGYMDPGRILNKQISALSITGTHA